MADTKTHSRRSFLHGALGGVAGALGVEGAIYLFGRAKNFVEPPIELGYAMHVLSPEGLERLRGDRYNIFSTIDPFKIPGMKHKQGALEIYYHSARGFPKVSILCSGDFDIAKDVTTRDLPIFHQRMVGDQKLIVHTDNWNGKETWTEELHFLGNGGLLKRIVEHARVDNSWRHPDRLSNEEVCVPKEYKIDVNGVRYIVHNPEVLTEGSSEKFEEIWMANVVNRV